MSAPSFSTNRLDHIVHLSPPRTVDEISQQFRELGFNVLPGGTHAGGETSNALVIFEDSTYLELISFNDEPKEGTKQPWAFKSPGWVDYAFLGSGSDLPGSRVSEIINSRLPPGQSLYAPEFSGGRSRPDGVVLKWLLTIVKDKNLGGILPFFCGDVTPRENRVPTTPKGNVEHPNGAKGVAYVKVSTNNLKAVSEKVVAVTGEQPFEETNSSVKWKLITGQSSRPVLELVSGGYEQEGIYEVGILVPKGKRSGTVQTPYGTLVWVEQA